MTAKFVDVLVTGGNLARPGERLHIELKSWTDLVLRSKTSFAPGQATSRPGSVGYQLLRDTALFRPQNILRVFDGTKVGRGDVARAKGIVIDPSRRSSWATTTCACSGGRAGERAQIRALLDQVIDIF